MAVVVLVLLIIVVLAIMLRQSPDSQPAANNQVPSQPAVNTPVDATDTPVVPVAPPVATPKTTTMIFVERFSSYSSESDFANVTDVLSLVTPELAGRIQAAAKAQATGPDAAYYGISTKVITQKITEQTETLATVLVSTQRAESIGSPSNTTVRYQDITVTLIKNGNSWIVSDYSWGE